MDRPRLYDSRGRLSVIHAMDSAEARHTASRSASAERFRRPATRSHPVEPADEHTPQHLRMAGPFGRERPLWISRGSTNFGRILHVSRSRISLLEATLRQRKDQAGNDPFESRSYGGEAGIRTLGTTLRSYNGLANRRLQPLGHLTVGCKYTKKGISAIACGANSGRRFF